MAVLNAYVHKLNTQYKYMRHRAYTSWVTLRNVRHEAARPIRTSIGCNNVITSDI